MSVQVGKACYATPGDAGNAACAAYQPESELLGDTLRSVSCASSDPQTGALELLVSTTDIISNTTTTALISHPIAYPDCIQGQFIDASLSIGGAVISAVAVCWGLWAVRQVFVNNTRYGE